ncbi:hypothetical protein HBH56_092050 [Parastagonospora nodorum]|nr:hypothetical protein HBH56_092050 [Parastagonospora nodorum]KAH3936371.1 hypothetical protein HBH54_026690 [Parastagonospora nodorum]KAH4144670.1 hypothetical protein HBH45_017180 [Parastagonospora nodorum]KAH4162429.1 hypothetical protein HBH44_089550 [Parastagonospora nodorum]KAH4583169.1 hypothetical protein HBH84_028980 [Parastagonospora nodorum]
MAQPTTSSDQVSTTNHPQDNSNEQQAPAMKPQFKLKQPWEAPIFHQAFKTKAGEDPPPDPTPLLTPAPSIVFVPAANTPFSTAILALPAFPPSSIIEFRHLPPKNIPIPTTPNILPTTPQVYAISPSHTLPPGSTYHCSTLFDLRLILPHLTPTQRRAIQTLKIRWATAECALWECYHPEHVSKTCVNVFALLKELKAIVVDCEGRGEEEVRGVKEDLEGWVEGLGVRVEMVGEKVEENGGKWWEGSVGWMF